MFRRLSIVLVVATIVLATHSPAYDCSLCNPNSQSGSTLRQELGLGKLVLYGTLANPKLNPAGNGGTTELKIDSVIKNDPFLGQKNVVELQRYVPFDAKDPPKYLVFCDIFNGKLDAYRGIPVKSAAVVDYLRGAATLDAKDSTKALEYFFRYLDNPDQDVANDAYLEFAKANDQQVSMVAPKLDPAKLRKLLSDPQTPAQRLGLFAFLLGSCGGNPDAEFLRGFLDKPNERTLGAFDGFLAGYIQLQAHQGWNFAQAICQDPKKPFTERNAVVHTLRFFHGAKPEKTRADVHRCLDTLLDQGDIADLAINDLRKWEWWDSTKKVLSLYGKETHKAPIMRRAIVHYALACPERDAKEFIDALRKKEPDLVKDVEELRQFEK